MVADELLEGQLATLLSQWHRRPPTVDENLSQDLVHAVLRLRQQLTNEKIEELQRLQHQARTVQDLKDVRHYTELVEQYKQQRNKLDQTQNALTLMGKRRAESSRYGAPV
jgi:predicted RecB family endonuclease